MKMLSSAAVKQKSRTLQIARARYTKQHDKINQPTEHFLYAFVCQFILVPHRGKQTEVRKCWGQWEIRNDFRIRKTK